MKTITLLHRALKKCPGDRALCWAMIDELTSLLGDRTVAVQVVADVRRAAWDRILRKATRGRSRVRFTLAEWVRRESPRTRRSGLNPEGPPC